MKILAISGSLRANSKNTKLLKTAGMDIYSELTQLPYFNPDLDTESPPEAVARFRRLLRDADAVLISSPEYAHGVPGVLKNALDWIVSSGEFVDKPVALVNASLTATHAQASLKETLTVMLARIVVDTRSLDDALQALRANAKPRGR